MSHNRIGIRGLMAAAMLLPGAVMAAASPTYSAQLGWIVPTQRDNGQALQAAELTGYEVYYTSDDPSRSGAVKVAGGGTTSVSVPNLVAGKYYFTIAAIDSAGLKSQLSNMVESQVGATPVPVPSGPVSPGPAPNAIYSVAVKWKKPGKGTNGKSLPAAQIAGYELSYVGGAPLVSKVVRINNNATKNYMATCLSPGNYQFTVAAIDANGIKISGSKFISKVVKAAKVNKKGVLVPRSGNPFSSGCGSEVATAGTSNGSTGSSAPAVSGGGSGSAPAGSGGTAAAGPSSGGSSGGSTGTSGAGGSVSVPSSYTAQLSWEIPSQRENGQPLLLSELAGYEVYYTADNPALSGSIKINGGGTARVSVPNLAAGQYYFSISAIDSAGLKSELSTPVPVKFGL